MATYYFQWLKNNLHIVRSIGEIARHRFSVTPWIESYDGAGLLNAFTPKYRDYKYNGYDFCHKVREYGLSLVTHRPEGPIRFTPPMNVTIADMEKAFEALDKTHRALVDER